MVEEELLRRSNSGRSSRMLLPLLVSKLLYKLDPGGTETGDLPQLLPSRRDSSHIHPGSDVPLPTSISESKNRGGGSAGGTMGGPELGIDIGFEDVGDENREL